MYACIDNHGVSKLLQSTSVPIMDLGLKLRSELPDLIGARIEFQKDAPENEKLVLNRSILGLGRVIVRDDARVFEQMNRVSRYVASGVHGEMIDTNTEEKWTKKRSLGNSDSNNAFSGVFTVNIDTL